MQIEITKQSEKDFRFLLSRLSHEIRNPVTLINSELQLMASSHPELCSYRQWDSRENAGFFVRMNGYE